MGIAKETLLVGNFNRRLMYKARRVGTCRAFSLLEMVAVVTILGIFAAMAVTTFGHDTLANAAAEGYARRMAIDLLQAQRRAISSGDNYLIQFETSSSTIIGHMLYERTGPSSTFAVDDLRSVPADVTVTSAQSSCEYTFEGSTLSAFTCTVAGPDRSWQVLVMQVTGFVQVTEL